MTCKYSYRQPNPQEGKDEFCSLKQLASRYPADMIWDGITVTYSIIVIQRILRLLLKWKIEKSGVRQLIVFVRDNQHQAA